MTWPIIVFKRYLGGVTADNFVHRNLHDKMVLSHLIVIYIKYSFKNKNFTSSIGDIFVEKYKVYDNFQLLDIRPLSIN